ncbi:hypothetical protein ACJX0J_040221, partial [Zea mays]
ILVYLFIFVTCLRVKVSECDVDGPEQIFMRAGGLKVQGSMCSNHHQLFVSSFLPTEHYTVCYDLVRILGKIGLISDHGNSYRVGTQQNIQEQIHSNVFTL